MRPVLQFGKEKNITPRNIYLFPAIALGSHGSSFISLASSSIGTPFINGLYIFVMGVPGIIVSWAYILMSLVSVASPMNLVFGK